MRIPFRLVVKNLFKHPIRAVLTIGSLAVALFLLCFLRSLVVALEAGVRAAKSDRIIVQSAVSLFVDLPEGYEPKIAAVKGVERLCKWSWFGGYYQKRENFFAQFACDHTTLLPMYPELEIVDGDPQRFQTERRACLIGQGLAEKFDMKVGDSFPITGVLYARNDGEPWNFQVAAIYKSNSSNVDNSTLFFRHDYLQKSMEEGAALGPTGVGLYIAKIAPGYAPADVMSAIDALFENGPQRTQSTTEAEFQAQFVSMVGNIPFFVSAIGGGVLIAILLAVVNTMLMAAREQTRDAGILKALGFRNGATFWVMLLQALFLAVAGGGLGLGIAVLTEVFFKAQLGTTFPGYAITKETLLLGALITVAVGLLSGIAPALRLARLNPVASLRAEA